MCKSCVIATLVSLLSNILKKQKTSIFNWTWLVVNHKIGRQIIIYRPSRIAHSEQIVQEIFLKNSTFNYLQHILQATRCQTHVWFNNHFYDVSSIEWLWQLKCSNSFRAHTHKVTNHTEPEHLKCNSNTKWRNHHKKILNLLNK